MIKLVVILVVACLSAATAIAAVAESSLLQAW